MDSPSWDTAEISYGQKSEKKRPSETIYLKTKKGKDKLETTNKHKFKHDGIKW